MMRWMNLAIERLQLHRIFSSEIKTVMIMIYLLKSSFYLHTVILLRVKMILLSLQKETLT